MEETTEKRPVSYTRRAFYWFLAPLGVLVLIVVLLLALSTLEVDRVPDWIDLVLSMIALIVLALDIQCIRYADKALEAGETRWKNIVMMVLAGITILVQVPTVLMLLAELVSMLF